MGDNRVRIDQSECEKGEAGAIDRNLNREYRFRLECQTATSLRVGSGEEGEITDAALWRRSDGRLVLPGTSIAGALRNSVERMTGAPCRLRTLASPVRGGNPSACGCEVCRLFGDVNPAKDKTARASKLIFRDVVIEDAQVRVVDGVALDRKRKTASERRKYDFEEVTPGARLTIDVRGLGLARQELEFVGAALRLLGDGRIPLGGRTAQGCGRLAVKKSLARWRDPAANSEHLIAMLLHDTDDDLAWPETLVELPGKGRCLPGDVPVSFTISIPSGGTLLIGDPMAAVQVGFDRAPRSVNGSPELASSSLRGALRSGAERILRTLSPPAACDPTSGDLSCASLQRRATEHGRSLMRCHACQVFGNEEWASKVQVEVGAVIGSAWWMTPFDHLAIDRFTGGARESLKFDAQAVTGAAYPVKLTLIDVPDDARRWVTGLLALTIQDLAEGRINVGYGAARGHGQIDVVIPPQFPDPLEDCIAALWLELGCAFPRRSEA